MKNLLTLVLSVVLVAIGCSGQNPEAGDGKLGSVTSKVTLPTGTTITSINWTLNCSPIPPPVASGTWQI